MLTRAVIVGGGEGRDFGLNFYLSFGEAVNRTVADGLQTLSERARCAPLATQLRSAPKK